MVMVSSQIFSQNIDYYQELNVLNICVMNNWKDEVVIYNEIIVGRKKDLKRKFYPCIFF
jgi:hypothetical protein